MELLGLRKPDLVVAIDVGSTYSGYAWQWRDDFENNKSNVEFNTNWGAGALQLHKTKTCLLLNKKTEIDSFGHEAEEVFSNECDTNPETVHENWFFFKGFKTILYSLNKNFPKPSECQVEASLGRPFPFKEVMTKFIKALKDHFLEHQLKDKRKTVDMDKILWVITVPHIWTDTAKAFMRTCAEESGIKRSHVLLALEPEVAALSCLHLPSQQRESMNNFGNVGDKFVTVDLGGGTADISAIEVLPDGLLKELCAGNGDMVGGQDVNNAFFQTCTDVIDGQIWKDTFCGKNAAAFLELENEFERRKVAIGRSGEKYEYISLPLPFVMHDQLNRGNITLRNTEEASSYFKTEGGKFQFKSAFIREKLFDTTVQRILTPIVGTMKTASALGISTIVLVGGFAESPIVVQRIRQQLELQFPDIHICVPTSPFRSVLYGAVLFGHDPFIFKSRICKETYGIKSNGDFDEKLHDQAKRWTNKDTGKDKCRDVFCVHVTKGQSVVLNENQPSKEYYPSFYDQKSMTFPIVSSPFKNPTYTTDEGCKQLGEIKVDVPDTTGQLSRKVKVTMIYGGTELAVIATDVTTGKDFKASINFDVA